MHAAYLNKSVSSVIGAHGTLAPPPASLGSYMVGSIVSNSTYPIGTASAASTSHGRSSDSRLSNGDTLHMSAMHTTGISFQVLLSVAWLAHAKSTTSFIAVNRNISMTAHDHPDLTGTGPISWSNRRSTSASRGNLGIAGINATVTNCLAALASFASANRPWTAQPGHLTVINSSTS